MLNNLVETFLSLNDRINRFKWLINPSSKQLFARICQAIVKVSNQCAFFALALILIFDSENLKVFIYLRVKKRFKFGLI